MLTENEYWYKCYVLFVWDFKVAIVAVVAFVEEHFPGKNTPQFKLYSNCYKICCMNNSPWISSSNGYPYSTNSVEIKSTDRAVYPVTNTLHTDTPSVPRWQVRNCRANHQHARWCQYCYRRLPGFMDVDYASNVDLKRKILHKFSYVIKFAKNSR